MAFAAGMAVFPGGSVRVISRAPEELWRGPEPQEWAERLGTDVPDGAGLAQRGGAESSRELVVFAGDELDARCRGG